jgi:hypothetical protein
MSLSDNDKGGETLFKERQTFQQGWLRIVLVLLSAFLIALSLFIIYDQLFQSSPPGGGPLPEGALFLLVIVMLAIGVGIPAVIFRAELLVTVDRDALRISFAPFVRRAVPVQSIVYCEPRTIQPIKEYVGMGILVPLRGGGVGYSVSGNEGVQIELANGKRLFVGSQYPEDLARAVAVARSL